MWQRKQVFLQLVTACVATACDVDLESGAGEADEAPETEQVARALTPWTPPFMFPSRGLAANHAWRVDEFNEGEYILDLDVARWDGEIDRWTARDDGVNQATYDADKTNDKHLVHGLALYAPIDGRIKSCWRNFPENPEPKVKLDEVTGDNDTAKSIFLSGNHVSIEADDGTVILLAHMKTGTVPSSLCPFNGTSASTYKPPGYSYPPDSLIPEDDRPTVKRGDFVGRAGNSGNSEGPHVHVARTPLLTPTQNGDSLPTPWFAAWTHPYHYSTAANPDDWSPLDDDAITATLGKSLIWPSPFFRRGSATHYNVIDLDSVAISGLGTLSAARDAYGHLRLSTWAVSPDGDVTEVGADSAGTASQVSVAHPSLSRDVVVAMRTETDKLKLIYWGVAAGGGLTRKGGVYGGAITRLDMVRVPTGGVGVVTAVRTESGQLEVIAWDVDGTAGEIHERGSDTAGYVSTVAATGIVDGRLASEVGMTNARFEGVVTASIAGGKLELNSFEVTPNLGVIHRDIATAGSIASVRIATVKVSALREIVITAVRTKSTSRLKLIAWEVSSKGAIERLGSIYAGDIEEVEIQPAGTGSLVTAVRQPDGNLEIIAWEVTRLGELRRLGDYTAGDIKRVSLSDRLFTGGREYFTTAVRLSDNAIKVIAFETNL